MADLSFLEKAISLTNECDLQYKTSINQRLHVELCLMQIASVEDEKKKDKPYIKPALKTDKAPQKPAAKEDQINCSQSRNPLRNLRNHSEPIKTPNN